MATTRVGAIAGFGALPRTPVTALASLLGDAMDLWPALDAIPALVSDRFTCLHHLNRFVGCGPGGLQQVAGAFARVAVLKYGAARHENLGAGAHDALDCVVMDAAVHFNAKIQPARLADLRQELNLF